MTNIDLSEFIIIKEEKEVYINVIKIVQQSTPRSKMFELKMRISDLKTGKRKSRDMVLLNVNFFFR